MSDYDLTLAKEIREHADYLKQQHIERNKMDDAMERMFLMISDEESEIRSKMQNVKLTIHPGARNKLLGAIRLLIARDLEWSMPHDVNNQRSIDSSDKIEQWAKTTWQAAGRIRGEPIHFDAVTSMLLFGETHIAVTKTEDMVAYSKGANKAAQARAEEIAEITPYLFDAWDPRTCYPELGPYGCTAHYREVVTTSGDVLDQFGKDAIHMLKNDTARYNSVTLCHFWDSAVHLITVLGADDPLIQE